MLNRHLLDRISSETPLIEWRPSRRLPNRDVRHQIRSGRQTQNRLSVLTTRFRNALKKSVEGIVEAGRVLIEAKNELDHRQFTDWVVNELRFGTRKAGKREADVRQKCSCFWANPCHWHAFSATQMLMGWCKYSLRVGRLLITKGTTNTHPHGLHINRREAPLASCFSIIALGTAHPQIGCGFHAVRHISGVRSSSGDLPTRLIASGIGPLLREVGSRLPISAQAH